MDERRVDRSRWGRASRSSEVGALIDESAPGRRRDRFPAGVGARRGTFPHAPSGARAAATSSPTTPRTRPPARRTPFFAWMRSGVAVFRAAERAGYPAYGAGTIRRARAWRSSPTRARPCSAGCVPPAAERRGEARVARAGVLRAPGRADGRAAHARPGRRRAGRADRECWRSSGATVRSGRSRRGRHRAAAWVAPAAGYRRRVQTRARRRDAAVHVTARAACGAPDLAAARVRARARREAEGACSGARVDEGERDRAELEASEDGSCHRRCDDEVRDARDPRRPGPRRALRRRQRPDLPDLHVRAGRRRPSRRSGTTVAAATRRARRSSRRSRRSRAERGFAFASGMAAETTLLLTLRPGDHVVLADDVYGGTYRLLTKVLRAVGARGHDRAIWPISTALRGAMRPRTTLVWIETPSNPLLKIVDIAAVSADRARGRRAGRRRQHVRDAGAAATARARRRRRRAQRDEVHRRALRSDRRRDRHERRGVGRAARVPHERRRARCPDRWTATWRSAA